MHNLSSFPVPLFSCSNLSSLRSLCEAEGKNGRDKERGKRAGANVRDTRSDPLVKEGEGSLAYMYARLLSVHMFVCENRGRCLDCAMVLADTSLSLSLALTCKGKDWERERDRKKEGKGSRSGMEST